MSATCCASLTVKPIAWWLVFRCATKSTMKAMLLWAAGITAGLTLADRFSVASNLATPAILLTLALYGLMSFTLIPLAWKVKQTSLSVVLNLLGLLGAFAGVNFTMDVLRGFLPMVNR